MEEKERRKAVQRHLNGESPKSIYTDLNRSKKWFFKWLKRYQTGELDWYKDKSRAPLRKPTQTGDAAKQVIVSTRKRLESHPSAQIGVSAIKWELQKTGFDFPSDRTIHRILKQEGLVKKNSIHSQRSRISVFYESP